MAYKLTDEDYLKLNLHFQQRADDVKEAMFRTLTWTVGFAAAILGLIFSTVTNYDPERAMVSISWILSILCGAGLVVCLYSWFMLSESAKHIQSNWSAADRCGDQIEGFTDLIRGDVRQKERLAEEGEGLIEQSMPIWNQLRIIVLLFAMAFLLTLSWNLLWSPANSHSTSVAPAETQATPHLPD